MLRLKLPGCGRAGGAFPAEPARARRLWHWSCVNPVGLRRAWRGRLWKRWGISILRRCASAETSRQFRPGRAAFAGL